MRMRALGTLGTLVTATALAVAGAAVPAQAAEGRVFGAGEPGAVPGRYIVTTTGAGAQTRRMTAVQARRLAADPDVLVEQDRLVHIEGETQRNPTWGLDRIDQRAATVSKTYTPMDDGSSVHAYVIDTGIRLTHQEFGGRAESGWDFVDGDGNAGDCEGHGTHVAGTIGGAHYGVAKRVRLVAVRVLDCEGSGYISDVIGGIDWVTAHAAKPAVANMSLGGSRSASLDAAVARSIKAGITYVVAAGNENSSSSTSSPAAVAAAITVGATDSRDRRASFSNYGSGLDLFAPGVNIRSSVATSNTATAIYSGTSMAAPHVAGAAALVLDAAPGYTPQQVRDYLVARATTGKVTDRKGSPNRLLYVPPPVAAPAIATKAVTPTVGEAYSLRLASSLSRRGTWRLTGGTLPTGLQLAGSGLISGVASGPGSATVQVAFSDYVPNTVTKTLTVSVQHTDPAIVTDSLPDATVDEDYSASVELGDLRQGSWAVTAGELPDGLYLDDSGSTAVISGTPTTAGTSTVTLTFTDGWGATASGEYPINVN